MIISEFPMAAGEGKFQSLNNFKVIVYVMLATVPLANESHRGRKIWRAVTVAIYHHFIKRRFCSQPINVFHDLQMGQYL